MPAFYRRIWKEQSVSSQTRSACVFMVTKTKHGTEVIIYRGAFRKHLASWFDIFRMQGVIGILITKEAGMVGFTPLRLPLEGYYKTPPVVSADGLTNIYLAYQPQEGKFGSSRVEQSFVTTEEVGSNLTVNLLATFLTHELELNSTLAIEIAERALELGDKILEEIEESKN